MVEGSPDLIPGVLDSSGSLQPIGEKIASGVIGLVHDVVNDEMNAGRNVSSESKDTEATSLDHLANFQVRTYLEKN